MDIWTNEQLIVHVNTVVVEEWLHALFIFHCYLAYLHEYLFVTKAFQSVTSGLMQI